jgi:hypothetical protein
LIKEVQKDTKRQEEGLSLLLGIVPEDGLECDLAPTRLELVDVEVEVKEIDSEDSFRVWNPTMGCEVVFSRLKIKNKPCITGRSLTASFVGGECVGRRRDQDEEKIVHSPCSLEAVQLLSPQFSLSHSVFLPLHGLSVPGFLSLLVSVSC